MSDQPELAPAPVAIDLTSERYRNYTYPDGVTFRITAPVALYITADGSHRVVDAAGVTHRPTRGFVGISWKPKDGQPAFVA
jgi:hypothetical protein